MQTHKAVNKARDAKNAGFMHLITIPWAGQNSYWWNDACADVLEVFGLPGNKYMSHPRPDGMDFYFKSHRDAELCKILLSEKLTTSYQDLDQQS